MLIYSWKASPNRWGRSEFNASFSIGFGNGLFSGDDDENQRDHDDFLREVATDFIRE